MSLALLTLVRTSLMSLSRASRMRKERSTKALPGMNGSWGAGGNWSTVSNLFMDTSPLPSTPFPTSHLSTPHLPSSPLPCTSCVSLCSWGRESTSHSPPPFSLPPSPLPHLPPLLTSTSCGSLCSGGRGSTSRTGRCLVRVLTISRDPP